MELRVESCEGHNLPNGCYVGVRVGEVLKQGRYEPQRCYYFPQGGRTAKIDIYQHVGSCVVAVDQDVKSNHEVNVTSTEPSFPATKLNVSVQPKGHDTGKQEREERAKVLKDQAKDYLSKHRIEERLSEAVKALLKDQPTDPTKFLCKYLSVDQPQAPQKQVAEKSAQKEKAQAPATKQAEAPKPAPKPSPEASKPPAKEAVEAKESVPAASKEESQTQSHPSPVSNESTTASTAAEPYPWADAASMFAKSSDNGPLYTMNNVSVVGPAFASFGLQPGLLFI